MNNNFYNKIVKHITLTMLLYYIIIIFINNLIVKSEYLRFNNNNIITDINDERVLQEKEVGGDPWWSYLLLPFINGIVGYGTNWLALKMTFYPSKPWGKEIYRGGPFTGQPLFICGWQGIIPTKAPNMAAKSVDMMMTKLFDIKEIMGRLDGKAASHVLKPGFEKTMNVVLDDVLKEQFPGNWEKLSGAIKSQLVTWCLQELDEFSGNFMKAIVDNLDDVFDLKHMVVNEFTEDPALLNRVFMEVGAKEMKFIERSGFYFGFLFGAMQVPLFYYFPNEDWILPVMGAVVGTATNWIALKMIFNPINPIQLPFGITLHGLFMQRQKEASAKFAEITCNVVLYSRNMFHYMLFGPKKEEFRKVLTAQTNAFLDKVLGRSHTLVKLYMGEAEFVAMVNFKYLFI